MTAMTIDLSRHPSLAVDEALAYAERAEAAHQRINEEHDRPVPDRRIVGRAHNELGLCLKLAEVHANLAVADAVDRLYLGLCGERVEPEPVVRVHAHPPFEPPCQERWVRDLLRGACLNEDGTAR